MLKLIVSLGPIFCVALCSIIPELENTISIPLGADVSLFGNKTLSLFQSFLITFLTSTLFGIILTIIFHFLLKSKKPKKLIQKLSFVLKKPLNKIASLSKFKKIVMCIVFTILPIPLAGVYGTPILCALLRLKLFESILCFVVGNLLDCLLVLLTCFALKTYISLFLTIMLIIILLSIIYQIISFIFKKTTKNKAKNTQ